MFCKFSILLAGCIALCCLATPAYAGPVRDAASRRLHHQQLIDKEQGFSLGECEVRLFSHVCKGITWFSFKGSSSRVRTFYYVSVFPSLETRIHFRYATAQVWVQA